MARKIISIIPLRKRIIPNLPPALPEIAYRRSPSPKRNILIKKGKRTPWGKRRKSNKYIFN